MRTRHLLAPVLVLLGWALPAVPGGTASADTAPVATTVVPAATTLPAGDDDFLTLYPQYSPGDYTYLAPGDASPGSTPSTGANPATMLSCSLGLVAAGTVVIAVPRRRARRLR